MSETDKPPSLHERWVAIRKEMQRDIERADEALTAAKNNGAALIERNSRAWNIWVTWLNGSLSTRGPKPPQPILTREQAKERADFQIAEAQRKLLCEEMRLDGASRVATRLGYG